MGVLKQIGNFDLTIYPPGAVVGNLQMEYRAPVAWPPGAAAQIGNRRSALGGRAPRRRRRDHDAVPPATIKLPAMRLLYKPFGIIGGIIASLLGRKAFDSIWAKIDDAPPPKPGTGQAPRPR